MGCAREGHLLRPTRGIGPVAPTPKRGGVLLGKALGPDAAVAGGPRKSRRSRGWRRPGGSASVPVRQKRGWICGRPPVRAPRPPARRALRPKAPRRNDPDFREGAVGRPGAQGPAPRHDLTRSRHGVLLRQRRPPDTARFRMISPWHNRAGSRRSGRVACATGDCGRRPNSRRTAVRAPVTPRAPGPHRGAEPVRGKWWQARADRYAAPKSPPLVASSGRRPPARMTRPCTTGGAGRNRSRGTRRPDGGASLRMCLRRARGSPTAPRSSLRAPSL